KGTHSRLVLSRMLFHGRQIVTVTAAGLGGVAALLSAAIVGGIGAGVDGRLLWSAVEAAAAGRLEYGDFDACGADANLVHLSGDFLDRAALGRALSRAVRRRGVFTACRASSYLGDRHDVRGFVSSAQRRPTVWELNDSCFRLYDQPDQLRYTDHQQFTRTNSSGAGRSGVCWRPQASTGDVEDSHPAAQTGFGLRLDLDGAPLLSRVDHGFGIGHEPSERHIAYDRLGFVAWRQSQSGGRRESGRADMHVAGCPTLFCFRSTQPDCGGCLISIAGVSKNFSADDRSVAALRSVHLEVNRGEFFVLLGPSGSGKTTLLRAVAGLEKPDQGEISLDGKVVYSRSQGLCAPPEERQVGMVFQSYAIWPHLTVAENIGLVLTHGRLRLSRKEAAERIRYSLSLVQLQDFETRPARLLSGGQQQRVALARALAINPALVLMDEPLSNLDARLREEVRTNIKKLAVQIGMTVLYVTHDQIEAMVLADRIAVMAHGEILQVGRPAELYRHPASALVAEFF